MKQLSISILFLVSVSVSNAQVQYAGSAVTTEVLNSNMLTTSISVPSSAFTSNLIAIAVTEYQHSYPLTITDVNSQKNFKLAQSTITKNGSLVAIYYLADAANGTHTIRVSTGAGNNTNIQTVTTAYTGVDFNAPIAFAGSTNNSTAGNLASLELACTTDQLVVDAMIYENSVSQAALPGSNLAYINRNAYNLESSTTMNVSGKTNLSWDYSDKPAGYWGVVAITLQPTRYAIVPGQLANFSGKPVNEKVALTWTTTFETNLMYISVMKSTDNKEWKELTRVNAAGNSAFQKEYEALDLLAGNVNNYYRLVFISDDGKKSYSSIVSIKASTDKKLRFGNMQNPFTKEMEVSLLTVSDKNVSIQVVSSKGITIASTTVKPRGGSVSYKIPQTMSLVPGIYYVQCSSEDQVISRTMMKY